LGGSRLHATQRSSDTSSDPPRQPGALSGGAGRFGTPSLAQDGRTARLGTGEFAIYDFNRPYQLNYDAAVQLAVFSFPREMLGLPFDSVRHLTAVPITADGAGALAAPLLRRVAADVETYRPSSAARLSTVAMDLITAAVAERADQAELVSPETQQRVLLLRIYAFIDQHLGETGLSPRSVASAHHVSLRSLHRLFESQNTTVAEWIRRRRLEHCRKDLADPTFHGVPVSTVAARWGLPDSAHFSRLFSRAYGLPPIEYRRSHLMALT
jgi:AraC-like DNA-binding protein